ncbi:MAG: MFS transporter [Dehalococcoidia bacterium]
MPKITHRGLVFLALCFVFIFALFFRTNTAVIVEDLMADFAIPAASLGLMASAFFYAYGIVQIPIGVLSDRFGVRHTVFYLGLLGVAGCILFALSTGLHMASWGRILIGIGTAGVWVPSLKYLAMNYRPDEFATMTGVLNAIGSQGLILATLPMAVMVEGIGWRMSYIIPSLIMLGLIIGLYRLMKSHPISPQIQAESNMQEKWNKGKQGKKASASPDYSFWHHPKFWRFLLWAFLIYGVLFSFQSLWGASYLQENFGTSRELAGTLLMFLSIGGIIGGVVWGLLSERVFRARRPVLFLGTIGMVGAFTALLLLSSYPGGFVIALIYFVLGFCGFTFLINQGCVKEFFPLEIAGTALGTVSTAMFIGVAVFQGITGYIIDLFGESTLMAYHVIFSLYLGSSVLACIMVGIMPETFPKNVAATHNTDR